jgi:hypothetical protein
MYDLLYLARVIDFLKVLRIDFHNSTKHTSIIPPNLLDIMDNGLACILMLHVHKLWDKDWEIGRSHFNP